MWLVAWLARVLASLVPVAMAVYGWFGIAVSGFCDTNCPTDGEVALYWVMIVVGLAGTGFVAALWLKRWRESRS